MSVTENSTMLQAPALNARQKDKAEQPGLNMPAYAPQGHARRKQARKFGRPLGARTMAQRRTAASEAIWVSSIYDGQSPVPSGLAQGKHDAVEKWSEEAAQGCNRARSVVGRGNRA